MKVWLIVIGCVAIFAALLASIFWFVMTLTAQDREMGRAFVRAFSEGDVAAVHGLMHPGLVEEFPAERITELTSGAAPYAEVTFRSIQKRNSNTSMQGFAVTAGGCESPVEVEMLSQKVTSFQIDPLCPAE